MNEKIKDIARIAFITGVIGAGLYQAKTGIDQRNRELDALCGGPTRPNCTRVETRIPVPYFDGRAGSTTIVEFIPKALPK